MWVSIAIGQLNWPVELDLEELFFHKAMRSEDGSISSQFWPVEHGPRQDPTDLHLYPLDVGHLLRPAFNVESNWPVELASRTNLIWWPVELASRT